MINCLLAITWLPLVTATGPQEKFNLPAGHYTLEQLASKLTQSGLPTKAASECKSEIIQKEFKFKDFLTAMGFINGVGEIANRMNHHPIHSANVSFQN